MSPPIKDNPDNLEAVTLENMEARGFYREGEEEEESTAYS
jgi:hypothetical protein